MGSNEKEIDSSSYIASASSIFHIRLCLGVYSLRKEVLPYLENGCSEEENSRHFDALYDNVFQPLCSSIRCYCNIKKLIDDYLIRIHQGSVIKLSNGVLIIEETINHDLNDLLRLFINNTYQAFHEQQSIMRFFGVDISAIYVKEFNQRIKSLQTEDPDLAVFLLKARSDWSACLVQLRNDVEHESWRLPKIEFHRSTTSPNMEIVFPQIAEKDMMLFLTKILNGLISFIESLTVYGLQHAIVAPIVVSEIPQPERNPACPVRFEMGFDGFGRWKSWQLEYMVTSFFDFEKSSTIYSI